MGPPLQDGSTNGVTGHGVEKLQGLLEKAGIYSSFLYSNMTENSTTTSSSPSSSRPSKKAKTSSSLTTDSLLKGSLRDYQKDGIQWMLTLFENGLHGILADEMGLGKTIQIIGLIAQLHALGVNGPFFIVAPLSTLCNWESEFLTWAPHLPVLLYHGDKKERNQLKKSIPVKKQHNVNFPIILTSYEMVISDFSFWKRFTWKYMIVDEGHRMKNRHCLLVQRMNVLKSENRLLLTGTPLQNSLSELWSLLHFILPDVFDDLALFESWFQLELPTEDKTSLLKESEEEPHVDGNTDDHDVGDSVLEKVISSDQKAKLVSKLHEILRPFVLRRLKNHVTKEIPPKREIIIYTPLSVMQMEYTELIVRDTFKAAMQQKYEGARQQLLKTSSSQKNKIMQLRKLCQHPYLVDPPEDDEAWELEPFVESSGKIAILDTMLKSLKKENHRVLIFSQMTRLLNLLQMYCEEVGYTFVRIDGSTKMRDRAQYVSEFQQNGGPFIFLLSTRAAGLGLNLTKADTVIFYDSDWNPQSDNQAQDRAHRIGQVNPVAIYRFISANSVEYRILEKTNAKRKLERVIIGRGDFKEAGISRHGEVSSEELEELLADHVKIQKGQHLGEGGISQKQLEIIMDRNLIFENEFPQGTGGYFVVDPHVNDSLVGSLE